MSRRMLKPSTVVMNLRAKVVALLVNELGYQAAVAKRVVARHEGLMLKAAQADQPVGPIALSIHLAHERETHSAA
jgi:hypothetical protein